MGATTTALTDGSTTTTIVINGNDVTASKGYLVAYNSKEFVFDGTKWLEFGDIGAFKALAYKDTASATYTPAGTVSQPSFIGSSSAVTITATDNTSGNYQPKGTISTPTFTGSNTTSVGWITPHGGVTVTTKTTTNKTATVSTTTGTATYTPAGTVSQPTFSGTATTSRAITATRLKYAIETWSPKIYLSTTEPTNSKESDIWFKIVS